MYRCLLAFIIGTAVLTATSGFLLNINFATCSNGKTTGNCTCPEGKVMAKLSKRLICFERSDACPNGYIGFFNSCSCFPGAEDSEGSCLKICSNCDNGWCSSSEKCECNQGFEMSKDNNCEPICENLCPKNGICSAPDLCSCKDGYRMSENNDNCEPICESFCPENATCSGPDFCSCNEGYKMSENNEKCEPVCEEKCSENGFCSDPGTCTCNKGYLKSDDNSCKPDCEDKCSGRECVAPGICDCVRAGGLKIGGLCLNWEEMPKEQQYDYESLKEMIYFDYDDYQ